PATTCPATPTGSAPAACSPWPRPPTGSACTSPPSRPGAAPGCSPPARPTTRTSPCSTRPTPPTPGWPNARAASSPAEFTPQQHQEVQYEAHVLSSADPGRPMGMTCRLAGNTKPTQLLSRKDQHGNNTDKTVLPGTLRHPCQN